MVERHLDDLAELYALGELSADEAAFVESHIAECAQCLQQVGEAEETVLALERQYAKQSPPDLLGKRLRFEQRAPAPWWRFAGAAAAGLVLGLGILWPQMQRGDESQRAIDAMIHSHFSHAQFAALAPGAPDAKVIYARDRSWLYVVASGRHDYEVDAVQGSSRTTLGTLHAEGRVSTLFIDHPTSATQIELVDRGKDVERARML
jgi:anti-sigma factor RsiW